jgi:hypothetical protein
MPQIWLSYDELAEYLGCTGLAAANFAATAHWSRRRCSDGLTRAKLPPAQAEAFLRHYIFGLKSATQSERLGAMLGKAPVLTKTTMG